MENKMSLCQRCEKRDLCGDAKDTILACNGFLNQDLVWIKETDYEKGYRLGYRHGFTDGFKAR